MNAQVAFLVIPVLFASCSAGPALCNPYDEEEAAVSQKHRQRERDYTDMERRIRSEIDMRFTSLVTNNKARSRLTKVNVADIFRGLDDLRRDINSERERVRRADLSQEQSLHLLAMLAGIEANVSSLRGRISTIVSKGNDAVSPKRFTSIYKSREWPEESARIGVECANGKHTDFAYFMPSGQYYVSAENFSTESIEDAANVSCAD